MDNVVTVTGTVLGAIARQRYPFAYVRTLDRDYNIPTEESFQVYLKELAHQLFVQYGDKWQTFFDCENISFSAFELAARRHFIARSNGVGSAEGVALGLLAFNLKPADVNTGHVLCTRLDGTMQLKEFEPQNRLPYGLTRAQCESVSLCLFF